MMKYSFYQITRIAINVIIFTLKNDIVFSVDRDRHKIISPDFISNKTKIEPAEL